MYYLLRIQPYNQGNILLQGGKYDLPDRLFNSVHQTFQTASEDIQDVREVIPEFYSLPELFLNMDHSPFGTNQDDTQVNHVNLPVYSHGSAYKFVCLMRRALESSLVSKHLHAWIDLVWGSK